MPKGFTMVEVLIVVGIILVLAAAAFPIYGSLQVSTQLNENTAQIIQTLRLAREQSLAGLNNQAHGVFFENNFGSNDKYISYQGPDYASRDIQFDREVILNSAFLLIFQGFNMSNDDVDINFSSRQGAPNNTGKITLVHEVSGSRGISVNSAGMVEED